MDDLAAAALGTTDFAAIQAAVAKRMRFVGEGELLAAREEVVTWLQPRRDEVLAQAERILRHEIAGWGETVIRHGPIVDFNADYGKSGKYGFHYWTWARPLIHAYLLTPDDKYVAEFDRLFNQWYDQRGRITGDWPGLDPIRYELGLGFRHRVFLEYYALPFARSEQAHERMIRTLLDAARWLFEEERRGYRAGNWQIIGSFGLAQIGLMVKEFKDSSAWVEMGTRRMLEHLERDFFPDGCHSERCPSSYSLVAYRDAWNLASLAPSPQFDRHLARIEQFFRDIAAPAGYLPAINDGARAPFKLPATAHSKHLPVSGFTVMRSNEMYLLINHGPSGGGHSHADSLGFELHAFGRPLAIDSGIGETYDDPNHLSWYVRSKAHNMVTIDGDDLDRTAAKGRDVVWQSNDNYDYFAAAHRGYEASKGIVHRRHVVFVKPAYFVVYDVINARDARTSHTIEWHLHQTAENLVIEPSASWSVMRDKAFACVIGIEGYEKRHEAIDWLTLRGSIGPGAGKSIAVVLVPYAQKRPTVEIKTIGEGDFVIRVAASVDHITFTKASVTVRRS